MKNLIKFLPVFFVLGLTFISCEDFVDVDNNNQLDAEVFYQTDEEANQAVLATYDILQWHFNQWGGWSSPYMLKVLPSDMGTAGGGSADDQPPYQALDELNFDATNPTVEGAWALNYFGIYRANLITSKVTPDTPTKQRIVAEAKALRAYYYLEIATLFGDAPLLTENITDFSVERTPVQEIYAQIELDLQEAISELPTKSQYAAVDQFRMTKGTAQALLGKAYLWQGKTDLAAQAFADVIGSGEYSLAPEYSSIFRESGEFGPGSMLEAVYTTSSAYDWGNAPWSAAYESNIHIQLMGPREGTFTGSANGLVNGWGFNYPSEKIWNAFISEGDTERRTATVISEQEWLDAGGDYNGNPPYGYSGYLRMKYGTISEETSTEGVSALNYGTNWRLLRYADVLLMAAEANMQSNPGLARSYVNMVRNRAGLDDLPTTLTGNDLFEAIVKERQLELAFEGNRYLDLIRWGMASQEIDGFQTGKHELFPIPQSEINRMGWANNPGY